MSRYESNLASKSISSTNTRSFTKPSLSTQCKRRTQSSLVIFFEVKLVHALQHSLGVMKQQSETVIFPNKNLAIANRT